MTFTCQKCNVERIALDCVPCLAQKLTDAYEAQKKRADDAAKILYIIQWSAERMRCPMCFAPEVANIHDANGMVIGCQSGTHEADCRLAALIGKAGA